ncbi:MAG: hypothetical protein Q9217_000261 [Psora testacea]
MLSTHTTSTAELEQKCAKLRQRLKDWEGSFATTHDGQKPSREDVKQHPDIGTSTRHWVLGGAHTLTLMIAQRYKDYNKLRAALASTQTRKLSSPAATKRIHPDPTDPLVPSETPRKRQKQLQSFPPSAVDPYDPPISPLLSPNRQRKCIGPTPQKDGHVLGLFDGMSSTSASKTPTKREALETVTANVQATPSKKSIQGPGPAVKGSQNAPVSNSEPDILPVKLTPSMQRIIRSCTPGSRGSMSKLRFDDTPAFLRRDSQRTFAPKTDSVTEGGSISWSPIAVRRLPQPGGRSLSEIVKGLRAIEDEQLDEELSLLREMEDGSAAIDKIPSRPKLLMKDTQRFDMPLGPDGRLDVGVEAEEQAIEGEGRGRDGKPLKVWRKKGQKRTTRRVNMKPNTAKWKPEPKWEFRDCQEEYNSGNLVETQTGDAGSRALENGAADADEEFDTQVTAGQRDVTRKSLENRQKPDQQRNQKNGGLLMKAKKKISATAHANFRALKIKNKHCKSKQSGRRFRTRR